MIPSFGSIRKSVIMIITKAVKSQELYEADLKDIVKSRQEYFEDEDFSEYFMELVRKCPVLTFEYPKSSQIDSEIGKKQEMMI